MEYLDEKLLEAKRKLNRQKYTTLETGIYAGEELITYKQMELFDNTINISLPEQFENKRAYLQQITEKLIPAFQSKLNILILEQINRQKEENAYKIKCIFLCRVMSSCYTESYEVILGISNSMLYLDEKKVSFTGTRN